ncbi:MAG: ABC transporter permease [Candidatus Syntrophosphaera sp.]|nr:ABC transporter permease [Candidatus Syntrophosphaera sp.]
MAELFDLIPTAPGDPLLLENGGIVPEDGAAVLTAEAARSLGVNAGGEVVARVTRSRGGRMENVEARLHVVAVLDVRAGALARVYAPLSFVLDVEAYKEGYAAPARGWTGDTPEPYASFDGAVLLLSEPLPPISRSGLVINTGFSRITDLKPYSAKDLVGFSPPQNLVAYDLLSHGASITASNLRAIDQKLRGYTRVLLPYVRDVVVRQDEETLRLVGLSINEEQARLLGLPQTPWGGYTGTLSQGMMSVLWPSAHAPADEITTLSTPSLAGLEFDLHSAGETGLEHPVVPMELLGVLRTATQRAVSFNHEKGRFEMARSGYRGFRLYAQSIDDVPDLYHRLKDQGIEVIAEVEAIERIQVLDQGLTRLFWLIALLGLFGGTAVLVASLYAAVERRRRDLGVLRLLGFSRRHVFFFPIAQGLMITALGLTAGFGGYGALAATINHAFASELAVGEAFCVLPWAYVPVFCLVTFVLATLASLAAAWRATNIDPGEVIREQ